MLDRAIACRPRAFNWSRSIRIGGGVSAGSTIQPFFLIFVIVSCWLVIAAPSHADIAPDPNTASLLCNNAAQRGTGGQPRKLLSTIDGERFRLYIEAEIQVRLRRLWFG